MSKYIKVIPISSIARLAVVEGKGRSLGQVKAATGADCICNGGFYDMTTGKPILHLKTGGVVLSNDKYGAWGYCWSGGRDITMRQVPNEEKNYISGFELLTPWDGIGAVLHPGSEIDGKRGRTALALTGESLILYCSGDGTRDGATPSALRDELHGMGAETAIMLDGGGSSQCDFGGEAVIASSRRVQNYICVWLEKKVEDKPVDKKFKVCIDSGHDTSCPNGSPDGSYREYEFAWDMGQRIKPHLERCGMDVVMTRAKREEAKSLTERAGVSNKAGCDVFLSTHTNAVAATSSSSTGWNDNVRGLLIFTSAAGENAGRNKLARCIVSRMREAGVAIASGGVLHEGYTVLAKTNAPANIVEYGFHTNREDVALLKDAGYRAKLAEATAKGVCDYLGAKWIPEPAKEPENAPWYANEQAWVKEMGISDGTRPEAGVTRAEVWAMIHHLYAAVKAGR